MPRKSSKNNKRTISSSSGTTLASRRHWIYAATTTKNDTHQNYLHQRVQRILVRSVPSTYSYFDGAVNDAVATGGIIEEGKAAADDDTVAKDESNEIQQVPHSTKLTYTQIPLPPQQPSDTTSSSDTTTTTTTTQYPSSYSKFTTPIITKDSRHAKFQFSLNYETHVPSKALISYVGTTTTASSSGSGENESGYVLQLPLSMGTVIGYSPPLEEGDDVVGGGEEEEEEEGEFAVERMECGEPLFRVLWDGCTAAVTSDGGGGGEGSSDGKKKKKNVVGYTEDLTLEELLTCLVTQPATKSSSSSSSSRSRNTTTDAPAATADGIRGFLMARLITT